MSSSDRVRDGSAGPRHETPPTGKSPPAGATPAPGGALAAGTVDPYATWLDRMQRARVRHAAITKNLYTWANYKSWTERVKGSWEEEPPVPKV
jgi:hypothetical protein